MSVDVCGFLEISSLDEEDLDKDHAWMSCIDLSSLGLYTGDECGILFGESNLTCSYADAPDSWPPIAKRRGVLANTSWSTTQAIKEALKNDNSIMSTWGFTYISYDEIAQIDWQAYSGADINLHASHGWGILFSLMKTLDNASKHQRLIVWFEWR
jgi:hypothetical protein